jgi:flagellar secretion chaperone FliS
MNPRDSASAYHQGTAFGASAVGQVVALYDTILRDVHRAMAAIAAGQIEKRVNAVNHALLVIGELQGVLDFARGGDAARNLNSFYAVTRGMINEASVNTSREKFQEVVSMYTKLRSAWSRVEQTVTPSEPTERLRISSQPQAGFPQTPPDPSGDPGGSTGSWSA